MLSLCQNAYSSGFALYLYAIVLGVLNLGAVDVWGQIILCCCGAVLYIVGWLAAALASPTDASSTQP